MNFEIAKNIKNFMKNFLEYDFLNIIENMKHFFDLDIIVNTTLKYQHKQALIKKLKLMGKALKYISTNTFWQYWALWSPGPQYFFFTPTPPVPRPLFHA